MRDILRVKSILKSKGWTMEQLANELGINKVSLSSTLNGNPTLNTLEKIANILNVPVVKLFHSLEGENYKVTSTDLNNTMIYKDDHVYLTGFLPHISEKYGSFCLTMKNYNFSIVPNSDQIKELVENDDLESKIFKADHEEKILIQYCGTLTALHPDEHLSFCSALYAYQKCFNQCQYDIDRTLGVLDFERLEEREGYIIEKVDRKLWQKLIKLTKKYDLDQQRKDFEEFNATGNAIIMYDRSIRDGYNIKMWLVPIENPYNDQEISVAWRAPGGFNNLKVLSGDLFTAQESRKFLRDVMIPKAMKL